MSDLISRQAAIALADTLKDDVPDDERIADAVMAHNEGILEYQTKLNLLPPAQPETATVTIGRTKGDITMWYECDACGEPVDQKDSYCRNCGRKLKHE